MNNVKITFLVCWILAAFVLGGCGGGNRFISNRGGTVESGELDMSGIPTRPDMDEYLIGQGDVLDVLFLYNKDLTQTGLKVRPDGMISLPYAGDVSVAGKSASSVDSMLTARFSEIIVSPDIAVIVKEYLPQVVYTMGEVESPGGYEYRPGMTLTNFIALSGSLNNVAKRNEVLVIRRIAPDHIVGIQIDLKELFGKKRFDLDIPLEAFDVVYVPKSRIESVRDFANAVKEIVSMPADLYIRGWQVTHQKVLFDYYKRRPEF